MVKAKILTSSVKPIEPRHYDGVADESIFYKFTIKCRQYLDQSGLYLYPKEQVGHLASFLTGKASQFYLQHIGMHPQCWMLDEFFDRLIDYCFPSDYHRCLRARFAQCRQGSRTIQEFADEIQTITTMLGDVSEREKVNKLWFGTHKVYRPGLRWSKLTPENSSFKDVLEMLLVSELAESPKNKTDKPNKNGDKSKAQDSDHWNGRDTIGIQGKS